MRKPASAAFFWTKNSGPSYFSCTGPPFCKAIAEDGAPEAWGSLQLYRLAFLTVYNFGITDNGTWTSKLYLNLYLRNKL